MKHHRWNPLKPEQIAEILSRYKAGEACTSIARIFRCADSSVMRHVRLAGLEVRKRGVAKMKIKPNSYDHIIAAYRGGKSCDDIAKIYGVNPCTIGNILRGSGVKARNQIEAKRVNHPLNEDAFSRITEESAYWIGFLMADGCVHYPNRGGSPAIRLGLAIEDIGHVEAFRRFLGAKNKITITAGGTGFGGGPQACLAIQSLQIANDLAKYGVVPRKSCTAMVKHLLVDVKTSTIFDWPVKRP